MSGATGASVVSEALGALLTSDPQSPFEISALLNFDEIGLHNWWRRTGTRGSE